LWLAIKPGARHICAMPFKVEHRIGVARRKEEVWAVLADFQSWGAWNPMYPQTSGKLLISAPVTVSEKVGDRTESYTATVSEWVPNTQIIWTRKSHGGLVTHVRYIEIEPLSDTGCIFANGELFQGALAPFLVPEGRRRKLRQAFRGFCEAMKARVEAGYGEDTEAWKRA
jgi:hypothetical protein